MRRNQLIDPFGRSHEYLRISVTDRCNFQCDYCMPSQGFQFQKQENLLLDSEILRLSENFVTLGITKIRLTGGEPLLRPGIETLIQTLGALEGLNFLAMSTNGFYLKGNALKLKKAGLQGLNISLDSLKPERFQTITGKSGFYKVLEGIEDSINAGFQVLKLNVVMRLGVNDDELFNFVALTEDFPLQIRFIEFMPFPGNGWHADQIFRYTDIMQRLQQQYHLEPILKAKSAVSKDFKIKGYQGTIGFITSMTESFCSTCDRLRLTADGRLKTCLFQPAETDFRALLRHGCNDTEIQTHILKALQKKQKAHSPMQDLSQAKNNPMIAIGG